MKKYVIWFTMYIVSLFVLTSCGKVSGEVTEVETDPILTRAAPSVTSVSSSLSNGSYGLGAVLAIEVSFDQIVAVDTSGGTPSLTLSMSPSNQSATYFSGSGTATLTFHYTVQAGDTASDLDYASTTALVLGGGSINSVSGSEAVLTLVIPGVPYSLGANKNIEIDTTAPVVSGVNSSLSDGTYKAGQLVPIMITFSKAVDVTGTPTLDLDITPTPRTASYASGTGTTVLVFNYTVQATDTSADLDYAATTSLALAGGTIKDVALNAATLTLAAPGAANSLGANKAIVIDTTAPNVPSGLALQSPATSPNTDTTPTIRVSGVVVGDTVKLFTDNTCTTQVGSATVSAGTTVDVTSSALPDATYGFYASATDPAGNASACSAATVAYVLDVAAPTVTSVSSSTANGSYKAGQVIAITITFSEIVNVTGFPTLDLATTPTGRTATYASGTGGTTLTFNYTVQATDTAADLDYAATTSLALAGGTIKDAALNAATLTLAAPGAANSLGNNKNIEIDTTAPASPSALALQSPSTTPDVDTTPTIRISGVVVGDTVRLFTDNTCTTQVGSATVSAGTTVDVTASALAIGAYTFYASSTDPAGNASTCSVASVAYTLVTPEVTFSAASQTVSESVVTTTITINLNAAAASTVSIPFTINGGSTATGGGTDYSITASPVTIAAGSTSTTITVTVIDDGTAEASETIVVDMGSPTNASQGATTTHTVTITDNDLGSFSVSGITGASDAVQDAYLNGGLTPIVTWSSSANATSYDVTIYESDGTTVKCATQNTASTSYDFSACTLTVNTTYKTAVISKAAGYTNTNASNSQYSFIVNRAPTITTSGAWYVLSSGSIVIDAQYAASPAVGTAQDADGDTLTFSAVGAASAGTATNNSTNVSYSPGANTGVQTFTFTVSDGRGGTASGTMTVHVVTAFTWTGGGANGTWTTAANWCGSINANKTGCANNGTNPSNSGTATHIAIFDGTCSSSCDVTVNGGNYTMYGLKLNLGYTGTFNQVATRTITIGAGGYTQAAGTFSGGNSAITLTSGPFALSGGTFTSTSQTLSTDNTWSVTGTPTFNHNSGTIQFKAPYTVNLTMTVGTVTYNNVTFNPHGSTMNLNSGTMTVAGNLVLSALANYTGTLTAGTLNVSGNITAGPNPIGGSSSLIVRAVGNAAGQTITTTNSNTTISNLTLVAGANNVTLSTPLHLSYSPTFTSFGTLTTPTSLNLHCAYSTTCTYNLGSSVTYTNLAINGNGSVFNFGGSTVAFTGTFTANGGNYTSTLNSGTLQFGGDISSSGNASIIGNGVIELTGNAAGQTITTASTSSLPNLKISAGANNVTLSGAVSVSGGYNVSSVGTLNTAGSTLKITGIWAQSYTINPGSATYNDVIIIGSNCTWTLGGNTMNVGGNLEYRPSNYGMTINSGNFFLAGNLSVVSFAAGGSAIIKLIGNAAGQTVSMSGTGAVPYLTVDTGANPSTALTANTRVTNLTLTTGNFLMSGFNLTNTTLSLNGNTLTKGGGTLTVNGSVIGTGSLFGGTVN